MKKITVTVRCLFMLAALVYIMRGGRIVHSFKFTDNFFLPFNVIYFLSKIQKIQVIINP
ncbi:hypothetical protein [Paenibacillus sp. IHBB 10380]|uniref:hypothetical protein n=1 Tax=Paenibacillus sp. IHBB 10380 TaxID=1566358 RepID=UPI001364C6CE|nr:hypothetical protein [Paenibacillus sp. IHBB 10380]